MPNPTYNLRCALCGRDGRKLPQTREERVAITNDILERLINSISCGELYIISASWGKLCVAPQRG